MIAMRLPKSTPEEKSLRHNKVQEGLKKALTVMRIGDTCWEWMEQMAKHGNMSSRSDLEVGAKSLETGIWGAHRNVLINLPQIEDESYKSEILTETEMINKRAVSGLKKVIGILEKR